MEYVVTLHTENGTVVSSFSKSFEAHMLELIRQYALSGKHFTVATR